MGLSWVSHSTLIYTSELILCSHICVYSATRHNIDMYPYDMNSPVRIPGRTGVSCVKLIKVRLMQGRTESMRALGLVKHCCCALNCTISTQKTKNVEKYPERANVRCFPIVQDSEKKYYAAEIPERERRMR